MLLTLHFDSTDVERVGRLVMDLYSELDAHDSIGAEDLGSWRRLLPRWFVEACAVEVTPEDGRKEVERFLAMPQDQKSQYNRTLRWRLSSWVAQSLRAHREWTKIVGVEERADGRGVLLVESDEPNDSFGSIRWAIRAANEEVVRSASDVPR